MKVSNILLLALAGTVSAKRVANVDEFRAGYEHEVAGNNDKRAVIQDDLNALRAYVDELLSTGVEYYVDLDALKDFNLESLRVSDLKKTESAEDNVISVFKKNKREAKHVVSLDFFKEELNKESSNLKKKRGMDSFINQIILGDGNTDGNPDKNGALMQSALTQVKEISIFASYIRDDIEINNLAGQIDIPMVIMAPTDEAISQKLDGLKPWEFPKNVDEDEANAEDNLANYVKSHIFNSKDLPMEQWDLFFQKKRSDNDLFSLLTLNGELLIIYNSGKIVSVDTDRKVNVVSCRRVENGYILVIDDSLVVPSAN